MGRLVFPDDGDVRRIDAAGRMLSAVGRTAVVYADAGATSLADIRTHPGGTAIAGSAVTVTSSSTLPLWQGPDTGADTLYVSVDGGPVTAVYARVDDRLDAVAAPTVGTTAGTVAAGDDTRIVGAAQKSANLSDLGSAATARGNLGLGGAATLAVGTTTGTVAAGDDTRIVGALQAASNLSDVVDAATARGNLGITAAAAVTAGATWQTAGNVTTGAHATATPAGLHVDIPAAAGDTLLVWRGGVLNIPGSDFLDMVVLVSGAVVWRASTGTPDAPGSGEGDPCLYPDQPGGLRAPTAPAVIPVTAGLVESGHVRVDLASNGSGGTVIHAGAYPGRWTWIRIAAGG